MIYIKQNTLKSSQQGVVLIEAMIAILIFSMGVLAVVGLQAAMIKNTTDSKSRADASYIAQQKIGQIWSDSSNAASYISVDGINISSQLPNGVIRVTSPAPNQFTVIVTWQAPGEIAHNFTTTASIAGG